MNRGILKCSPELIMQGIGLKHATLIGIRFDVFQNQLEVLIDADGIRATAEGCQLPEVLAIFGEDGFSHFEEIRDDNGSLYDILRER